MHVVFFIAGIVLTAGGEEARVTEATWKAEAQIAVPDVLDCDSMPEWRSFRLRVVEAISRGFEKSDELRAEAAALEETWRAWVCSKEDGSACTSSGDLGFEFVRDLHLECKDSNNFERYLVRHYFVNTGKDYQELPASRGFCLYGYATALVVLAWHSLPDHVGASLGYLYTALHMMGHYHSFDFLESSSWPISSFLILVNLMQSHNGFIPLFDAPEYAHPGQFHTHWYVDRLRWTNTTEAVKPKPGAAPFYPLPFDNSPAGWRGRGSGSTRPHIIVWQFCIHTSTAGEAVTMITRFLDRDFKVEFRGNSVAFQLCGNYEPSLCAQGRNAEFIDRLSTDLIDANMEYSEISKRFNDELLSQLLEADVWMCSIPAVFCQLLADAAKASGAPKPSRPIFAYIGLPIFQYVPRDNRPDFLHAFRDIVLNERNIVVANNPYLAEEMYWQLGLRVPTIRINGLHTNATWVPLRNDEVLVSRPGTSGGLQECLLRRFVDANPGYPLRFVQFTDLLNPHTTREVYNTSLSYTELGKFRALTSFPYDTSLMLFWEFYSMNVPIFIPFQLWRWGIFGQHTRPDLELPTFADEAPHEDFPPFSPFFDGFAPLDVDRSMFWSKFTDWAMFPHIVYFSSLPDLMSSLVTSDLPAISAKMKRFNEKSLADSVGVWRYVVERWLDLETFTSL